MEVGLRECAREKTDTTKVQLGGGKGGETRYQDEKRKNRKVLLSQFTIFRSKK
jgi:hypothetical protein